MSLRQRCETAAAMRKENKTFREIGISLVKSILEIHAWLGLPEPTEITEERRATEAAIRRAIKLLKANGYNVKKISKD